jgi:uncharacterized membrane protein
MTSLAYTALVMFAIRLFLLCRIWPLPLKHGENFFLGQRVGPGFYRDAGKPLLRRYHFALVIPLLLDVPLAAWLLLSWRHMYFVVEQLLALVITSVLYNLMVVHFSSRAASIAGPQEERPTTVQLSMEPRSLRDHTVLVVEVVIVLATVLSLGLLARSYLLSVAPGADHAAARALRGAVVATTWCLYWQIGFLLLKRVFVRWRMPLPANRTEDFRRWRAAWLSHHLKTFDAVRVLWALALLSGMVWINYGHAWPKPAQIAVLCAMLLGMAVYVVYVVRQGRRLIAAEREMKPIELAKEFPRSPIATGRYLAGGLLYFNRDNPGVIVRSTQGIAVNLAHPSTYIWFAYFLGLIALGIWMAK